VTQKEFESFEGCGAHSADSSPMSVLTEAALTKSQYLLEQLADLKFSSEDEAAEFEEDTLKALDSCLVDELGDQSVGLASLRSEVRRAVSAGSGSSKDTVEVPAVLLRMLGEMWEQVHKKEGDSSSTSQGPTSSTSPTVMLDDLRKIVNPKLVSSKLSSFSTASTMLPSPAPADGEASAELSEVLASRREWPRLSIQAPASMPSSPGLGMALPRTASFAGVSFPTASFGSQPGSPEMTSPTVLRRGMPSGESAVIASLQKATVPRAGAVTGGYPSPILYSRGTAPATANPARQVAAEVAAAVARAVPPQRVQSMAALSGAQSVTVTATITPTQVTGSVRTMGACRPPGAPHALTRVHSVPTASFQSVK